MTAVQLLWIYYEQADRYLQKLHPGAVDDDTSEVMSRWSSVLTKLERGPDGMCSRDRLGRQALAPAELSGPRRARMV
jgi:proteasome accessory factor A